MTADYRTIGLPSTEYERGLLDAAVTILDLADACVPDDSVESELLRSVGFQLRARARIHRITRDPAKPDPDRVALAAARAARRTKRAVLEILQRRNRELREWWHGQGYISEMPTTYESLSAEVSALPDPIPPMNLRVPEEHL